MIGQIVANIQALNWAVLAELLKEIFVEILKQNEIKKKKKRRENEIGN